MQFILILNILCLHIQQQDLVKSTKNASTVNVEHKDPMNVDKLGADEKEGTHVVSIHLALCSLICALYSNFEYIVFACTSKGQNDPHR
jgi:hypothetical protein